MKRVSVKANWAVGAVIASLAANAHATEVPYCQALVWEDCLDDTINLTLSMGASELQNVVVGTTFDVVASVDVRSTGIEGWSYGVFSDPNYIAVLDTHTTSAHPLIQQASFKFDQPAVSSNNGFLQAIVLDFLGPTYLPVGEIGLIMLTSQQEIIATPPASGTEVSWKAGLVGSGQPVALTLVKNAANRYPRKVRHLMVYP